MDLGAAQKEVKVCQTDSLQLTLKRLINNSGVNTWQANITSLDRPLGDYFVYNGFIFKLLSYGSDTFTFGIEKDFSGSKKLDHFKFQTIHEIMIDNLQDITYFSEPRTQVGTTHLIPITNPNATSFVFGIGFVQKTGFPIVHTLNAPNLTLCARQVGKHWKIKLLKSVIGAQFRNAFGRNHIN